MHKDKLVYIINQIYLLCFLNISEVKFDIEKCCNLPSRFQYCRKNEREIAVIVLTPLSFGEGLGVRFSILNTSPAFL